MPNSTTPMTVTVQDSDSSFVSLMLAGAFSNSFFANPSFTTVAFSICAVLVLRAWMKSRRLKRLLPPGPPGLPLLGNVFEVPTKMPWLKFTEWRDQYGPIFSLNMAGQTIIVLNSHKVTADLLERRSTIYSDRPRFIMAGEILTGGIFMIFASCGEVWRKMRRTGHEEFSPSAVQAYKPMQLKYAALTALDIVRTPEFWDEHIKQGTAATILSAVYGWPRITPKDKPLVSRIHAHTGRIASAVVPGAYMVELLPWMKHLPTWMARWKKEGLEWHERETDMFMKFNAGVRERVLAGDAESSFTSGLINSEQRHGLTEKEGAWLSGIMFSAGAETTAGSLTNFILAMTHYPDAMKKAQAELDAVIGRERIPTFADEPKLPYVRALVKEVMRWRVTGPLAVPRQTSQDDWYEGYLIPKGTMIIPNIWGMNRDPEIFPDPEEFKPERFLDATGTKDVIPPDTHGLGHVNFGFGRRICVGYHFANQVLFVQMAMLLWAFNIEQMIGPDGKPIVPSRTECIDAGVVVIPAPFKCKFNPRFPDVSAVLQREIEAL